MVGTLIFSAVLTYATFVIFHAFGKLGNSSCPPSKASEPLFDTYDEKYNEPIRQASPNNMISDIVKKGYLFFVTIEPSTSKLWLIRPAKLA